eukprot:SAG31_NODE_29266_length_398_cov_0.695652_1_plen_26_part_10
MQYVATQLESNDLRTALDIRLLETGG